MSEYVPTTGAVEIAAKLMWKERALGTTTPEYPWRGLAEEGRVKRLRGLTVTEVDALARIGVTEVDMEGDEE